MPQPHTPDREAQALKFPENAYRELKPGEKFVPMVPPHVSVPELTPRMFIFGLLMNVIFSVAATFLALKAGQGIETAIPISILAVGLSGFLLKMGRRSNSILENMYALSISTTSGYVAGGTCFTMPAIYILGVNESLGLSKLALFLQIALVPLLGAVLGSLFLIPFRRYFVKEMHGKLPFPEATATNEILVTGASGSTTQAIILIYSFFLSAIYTFAATGLRLFSDRFTTGMAKLEPPGRDGVEALAFGASGLFATLTAKVKAVFAMGTGAYYLGLGFIIGPRYASIICAGSFLSWFAIIPLLSDLRLEDLQQLNSAATAHAGAVEDVPRFALPLGELAFMDEFARKTKEMLPPEAPAYRAAIAAAFAANGVQLPEDAKFVTQKLGQEWSIETTGQTWVVKRGATELAVHKGKQAQPAFTVPLALADQLDQLDPKAPLRRQLGAIFAAQGRPFITEAVSVKVREAGKTWEVADKYQSFELRADPASGQVNVFAREAAALEIFDKVPKNIGIGAIFAAGLISIIKMAGVIVTALRQALGSLLRKRGAVAAAERSDEDISYGTMLVLGLIIVAAMAVFFRTTVFDQMANATWLTFISIVLALVITFLFTTVSAWAIAMISVTPISGMTVTTIIITAVLMAAAGLPRGDHAMLAVLLVGGVVCTGLSLAGGLITNFKLAYWLGASPRRITWNALAGSLVSAIVVCATIMILAYKPGYTGSGKLDAPQANMMASALESFLGTSGAVPWLLYGVGVVIALVMQLLGISPLAFGLGMYLPMYINTPILIGAFVALLVRRSARDEQLVKARSNKGILIASGLIAGGAIMEVLVSFTSALDDLVWKKTVMPFLDVSGRMIDAGADPESLARTQNWVGAVLFLLLCLFVYLDCRRAKPELAAGAELHG
ncbi:MAG: OPT/YSL family transporter [Planctomycetota bacterium]